MRCLDPRTLIVVVESFPFLFNGTRVHGEQMSAAIGLEDGGQLGVVDASAGGEHCAAAIDSQISCTLSLPYHFLAIGTKELKVAKRRDGCARIPDPRRRVPVDDTALPGVRPLLAFLLPLPDLASSPLAPGRQA